MRVLAWLLIWLAVPGWALADEPVPSLDFSGQTLDQWMVDPLGYTLLLHHPASAYPDGVLSESGLQKQVTVRRRVHGRRVRHTYTKVLATPEVFRDDRVLVFLPANLQPADPIQFVIFFHGWRSTVTGSRPITEQLHLRETVACAGTNAVLVVPQGPVDYPTSRFGRLERLEGLASFVRELGRLMPPLPASLGGGKGWLELVDELVLAGHSGGGSPISLILADGLARGLDQGSQAEASEGLVWRHLRRVVLLDATYGGPEPLVGWWRGAPGRRLATYYLKNSPTAETSERVGELGLEVPERALEVDAEGFLRGEMPGELQDGAHFHMPYFRLWKGLGGQGSCRWQEQGPGEGSGQERREQGAPAEYPATSLPL